MRLLVLLYVLSFMVYTQDKNTISLHNSCQQKTTVAVLEFYGNAIYATDICVSSQFREELKKTRKFNVMKRSSMFLVFEEAVYPWYECHETACAAEIGKILGV